MSQNKKIDLDTENLIIPEDMVSEWIWPRILCSIEFVPLNEPTSLDWALLSILIQFKELDQNITPQQVAENLGVEKKIVEEGLIGLIESKHISIQQRKDIDLFKNYAISELTREAFSRNECIPGELLQQKISLFKTPDNFYSYQLIDSQKIKEEISESQRSFDFTQTMQAIIEQLWFDIQNHSENFINVNSFDLEISDVNSQDLLNNPQMLIQNINVNFL